MTPQDEKAWIRDPELTLMLLSMFALLVVGHRVFLPEFDFLFDSRMDH